MGYGIGYGQARDAVCALADVYVTVDGDRSRYFGLSGTYVNAGAAVEPVNNLNSDFFYRQINASAVIEHQLALRYPQGPGSDARELVRRFVAGYIQYLADARLFSQKRWMLDRFCERDIRASPQLHIVRLYY